MTEKEVNSMFGRNTGEQGENQANLPPMHIYSAIAGWKLVV